VLKAHIPRGLLAVVAIALALVAILAFASTAKDVSTGTTDITAVQSVNDTVPPEHVIAVTTTDGSQFSVVAKVLQNGMPHGDVQMAGVLIGVDDDRQAALSSIAIQCNAAICDTFAYELGAGDNTFAVTVLVRNCANCTMDVSGTVYPGTTAVSSLSSEESLGVNNDFKPILLGTTGLANDSPWTLLFLISAPIAVILARFKDRKSSSFVRSVGGLSGLTRPISQFVGIGLTILGALALDTGFAVAGDGGLVDTPAEGFRVSAAGFLGLFVGGLFILRYYMRRRA
jgi:hypothetical protein